VKGWQGGAGDLREDIEALRGPHPFEPMSAEKKPNMACYLRFQRYNSRLTGLAGPGVGQNPEWRHEAVPLWRLLLGRREIEGDTANPGSPDRDRTSGRIAGSAPEQGNMKFSAMAGPFVCLAIAGRRERNKRTRQPRPIEVGVVQETQVHKLEFCEPF